MTGTDGIACYRELLAAELRRIGAEETQATGCSGYVQMTALVGQLPVTDPGLRESDELVRDRAAFFQAVLVSPKAPPQSLRVKSPRPRDLPAVLGGPWSIFRASRPALRPGGAGAAGVSDGQAAESAARVARIGRLEPVQEVLTPPERRLDNLRRDWLLPPGCKVAAARSIRVI
ncbi:MAG TPA: hypothetical protein VGG75_35390 [Trebonia sp.]